MALPGGWYRDAKVNNKLVACELKKNIGKSYKTWTYIAIWPEIVEIMRYQRSYKRLLLD